MNKVLFRFAFLLSLFLLLPALVPNASYAYSGVFLIKVSGSLKRTVFDFYVPDKTDAKSKERISFFTVQKHNNNSWTTIWRIRGDSSVSSVLYGSAPNGMLQDIKPDRFLKGCIYRVVATGESAFGANLYGTLYFSFDENGSARRSSRIP